MEENGQHQWNQQHQLALGTTLFVVCSPGRVFVHFAKRTSSPVVRSSARRCLLLLEALLPCQT